MQLLLIVLVQRSLAVPRVFCERARGFNPEILMEVDQLLRRLMIAKLAIIAILAASNQCLFSFPTSYLQ